jgi:Tfp pilus tip-associated adhesin PilY1
VFWLAYILDKDLSMHSKQPSIQIDDDINLDLPSPTLSNSDEIRSQISNNDSQKSVIATADEMIKKNYLTARVQLAAVQGGVYDYIYSTRSRKRNLEERSRALESVASALGQWKASLPPEFSVAGASKRLLAIMLRFIGAIHGTSLACATLINQAHAWDNEWVASIRKYSSHGTELQLPPKWEMLVDEARDLLILFGAIGEIDCHYFW